MTNYYRIIVCLLFIGIVTPSFAQQPGLQYFRPNDKRGLNVFETSKEDTVGFNGFKVRVGGDFAIQFQGLNQSNAEDSLVMLGSDFNLPVANLNLDVQIMDGVRMHLRTYLSSRHHPEAWVKGGHIQIDNFDFVSDGFLSGLMDIATIRIGLDEFNYGDAHFRRTDNARGIFNPFVGNYIMDSFSTEAFGELTLQKNGLLAVIGLTNGKLNQNVIVNPSTDNKASFFGKLGYDKQLSDDFRLRLTGSWYINKGTNTGTWLYGGDRGGGRYYHVMDHLVDGGSDFEGRFNPRFRQMTAIQFNPFIKYKGLEFFGIFEVVSNSEEQGKGSYTQIAAELLYRFGSKEQLYIGGRLNGISGEANEGGPTQSINRTNIGGGWFMNKNIVAKIEYVNQKYEDNGWAGSKYDGGEFSGIMIEAIIGF